MEILLDVAGEHKRHINIKGFGVVEESNIINVKKNSFTVKKSLRFISDETF